MKTKNKVFDSALHNLSPKERLHLYKKIIQFTRLQKNINKAQIYSELSEHLEQNGGKSKKM